MIDLDLLVNLGNTLGKNSINIASFHLGRRDLGGEAIASS